MSVSFPIYLDYCATTPLDPRVLEAMMPYFTTQFGNPSNMSHYYGQEAIKAVVKARHQLAKLLTCSPNEIVFTSGATESNNLVFKGVAMSCCPEKKEVITLASEHKSILNSACFLEKMGFKVTFVPIHADGRINLNAFKKSINKNTALVSIMYVNNETGVIQPIETLSAICKDAGILFHCDAAQALGKLPISLAQLPIDFLSGSGHKMYGPKGVGCLFVRNKKPPIHISPCIEGGGQEFGLRSGTHNVPGIVGFGMAAELALNEWHEDGLKLEGFYQELTQYITEQVPGVQITGSQTHRYFGNIHFNIQNIKQTQLMPHIQDLALSTGSACNSKSTGVSHVLQAMGFAKNTPITSLRISMGRFTTPSDIQYTKTYLTKQIQGVRSGQLKPKSYLSYTS